MHWCTAAGTRRKTDVDADGVEIRLGEVSRGKRIQSWVRLGGKERPTTTTNEKRYQVLCVCESQAQAPPPCGCSERPKEQKTKVLLKVQEHLPNELYLQRVQSYLRSTTPSKPRLRVTQKCGKQRRLAPRPSRHSVPFLPTFLMLFCISGNVCTTYPPPGDGGWCLQQQYTAPGDAGGRVRYRIPLWLRFVTTLAEGIAMSRFVSTAQ